MGVEHQDLILERKVLLGEISVIFDGHALELAVTDLMLVKLMVRKDQSLDGHFLESKMKVVLSMVDDMMVERMEEGLGQPGHQILSWKVERGRD